MKTRLPITFETLGEISQANPPRISDIGVDPLNPILAPLITLSLGRDLLSLFS